MYSILLNDTKVGVPKLLSNLKFQIKKKAAIFNKIIFSSMHLLLLMNHWMS